jgi:hypothetical protein
MQEHDERGRIDSRFARWIVAVALSVVWIFAVYLAYYTVHKPFTAQIVLSVTARIADLAIWMMLLLLAAAVGRRLLGRESQTPPLETLVFSVALGLGIFSLGTLFLGMMGMLTPWLFWVLFLVLLAIHIRDMSAILRTVKQSWVWRPTSRLSFLLTSFLCVTFLFALVAALTPPAEWDALVYHLTGPKMYVSEGRLLHLPDNFYLNFPTLTEMLFTCAMLLKGDILAHLIHLTYGLLTVLAIYSFSRKYFKGLVPLLASVLFASIPTAVTIAAWAYVDLALSFYMFMAFFALMNWFDSPGRKRWLVLAGVLCGMAMSVKYTGVTALVVVCLLVLLRLLKERTRRPRYALAILALILIATAVASPWYLKSAAYTGNPIYPYLFGGRDWNQLRNEWLTSIGMRMSPLELLLLPWDITVLGTQGTQAFDATISPYFLAVLPLILFVSRDHRMLVPLSVFAVTTYVLWITAGAAIHSTFILRTRILLPCFAPLSILTAHVVESLSQLDRKAFSLQRFVLMALALGLSANVIFQGLSFVAHDPLPFIVGMESREGFLRRHLADGHYDALKYINSNLPSSARVLFFWEPRSYYCEDHCLPDVVFDHFSQLAAEYGDVDAIAAALQVEETSHILVNQRWLDLQSDKSPFTEEHHQLFIQFRDRYLEPVYVDPGLYELYELDY